MEALPPYAIFPVLTSGIDWLTCTSKRVGVSNALEDFGMSLLNKEKAGSGRILPARRLGFEGLRSDNIFLGRRPGDVMLQISGPSCTPLTQDAIALSTNVSRIDVQVTVFTEGEQCNLAKWTHDAIVRSNPKAHAVQTMTLTAGWPDGDTLNINRRCSDVWMRLYDKSAEASLGMPRLVWRYELELKGKAAQRQAELLRQCGVRPNNVHTPVHAAYKSKGVEPAFAKLSHENAFQPSIDNPSRDVLTWMRDSLSKTVARAAKRYGRDVVAEALGIDSWIQKEGPSGPASGI